MDRQLRGVQKTIQPSHAIFATRTV